MRAASAGKNGIPWLNCHFLIINRHLSLARNNIIHLIFFLRMVADRRPLVENPFAERKFIIWYFIKKSIPNRISLAIVWAWSFFGYICIALKNISFCHRKINYIIGTQ